MGERVPGQRCGQESRMEETRREREEWGTFCRSNCFLIIWDSTPAAGKGIGVFSFMSEFKISPRLA